MNKLKLVKPSKKYLNSYLENCIEFKKMNIYDVSYHDPEKFEEWKDTIFQMYEDHSKGINLPKGHVSGTTYWLVEGNNFIGRGGIRHELNDFLIKYGGHIGYYIKKEYWGMGYGTLLLKLLLEKVTDLGIKKALLTCDIENIASARVIEKNGGKKIDMIDVTVDDKVRSIYRYEIEM